jgi:serine/threonine protein kinase
MASLSISSESKKKSFTKQQIHYDIILGQGRGDPVYEMEDLENSHIRYAVKKISKSTCKCSALPNEIEIYKQLRNCSRVLKLIDFFEDKWNWYIVLEKAKCNLLQEMMNYAQDQQLKHCKNVNSKEELHKKLLFPLPVVKSYVKAMVVALMQCHEHNVIHLDLKLENLFVLEQEEKEGDDKKNEINNEGDLLRLGDFGSSHCGSISLSAQGTIHTFAPEVAVRFFGRATMDSPLITRSADLWSLGVCTLELMQNSNVYEINDEEKVMRGEYTMPKHLDKDAADFVQKLLQKDPTKRMSLENCLKHPFLSSLQ